MSLSSQFCANSSLVINTILNQRNTRHNLTESKMPKTGIWKQHCQAEFQPNFCQESKRNWPESEEWYLGGTSSGTSLGVLLNSLLESHRWEGDGKPAAWQGASSCTDIWASGIFAKYASPSVVPPQPELVHPCFSPLHLAFLALRLVLFLFWGVPTQCQAPEEPQATRDQCRFLTESVHFWAWSIFVARVSSSF